MKSAKPILQKSPPGTHAIRCSPVLFYVMLAIIVASLVGAIAYNVRAQAHSPEKKTPMALPSPNKQ